MHHLLNRRAGLGALVTGALLAALALAPAAPAATIKACQKKKGGALRIITGKAKCKKTEKLLKWSTTGPAGTNGANGTNGTNGANGANGTNGAAGLPQKSFVFESVLDSAFPVANEGNLATIGDVTLKSSCFFFLSNITGINVTAPAGTVARTALTAVRSNGTDAPGIAQTLVRDVAAVSDDLIVSLTTNTSGDTVNIGHVTGTIISPTQVVWLDAHLRSGPSPTACTVKGTAFGIPR